MSILATRACMHNMKLIVFVAVPGGPTYSCVAHTHIHTYIRIHIHVHMHIHIQHIDIDMREGGGVEGREEGSPSLCSYAYVCTSDFIYLHGC